jgi:hypothetical protein
MDLDGNLDVLWWLDSGQFTIRVFYGDGKGDFDSRQLIPTGGDHYLTGGFVDVDGDGDLDFVGKPYCCNEPTHNFL